MVTLCCQNVTICYLSIFLYRIAVVHIVHRVLHRVKLLLLRFLTSGNLVRIISGIAKVLTDTPGGAIKALVLVAVRCTETSGG